MTVDEAKNELAKQKSNDSLFLMNGDEIEGFATDCNGKCFVFTKKDVENPEPSPCAICGATPTVKMWKPLTPSSWTGVPRCAVVVCNNCAYSNNTIIEPIFDEDKTTLKRNAICNWNFRQREMKFKKRESLYRK